MSSRAKVCRQSRAILTRCGAWNTIVLVGSRVAERVRDCRAPRYPWAGGWRLWNERLRQQGHGLVRSFLMVLASLCVSVLAADLGTASATVSARAVFYLALAPGQCAIQTVGSKTFLVVPCSDARHNFEVYAIGRGGWGHGAIPAIAGPSAIVLCQAAYRRITGHLLSATSGLT